MPKIYKARLTGMLFSDNSNAKPTILDVVDADNLGKLNDVIREYRAVYGEDITFNIEFGYFYYHVNPYKKLLLGRLLGQVQSPMAKLGGCLQTLANRSK